MWLAFVLSLLLGLFCLTLPHTPPARKNDSPLAFLGALQLLKNREFAIFLGLAFVVATELMILAIGALVGAIGSAIAASRFLDV